VSQGDGVEDVAGIVILPVMNIDGLDSIIWLGFEGTSKNCTFSRDTLAFADASEHFMG